MLEALSGWLGRTCFSSDIQRLGWVVPALQSVHILAIAALVGATLSYSLHELGLVARDLDAEAVARRYLPFVWWSLPVLLASGALLITAEPARSLLNPVFALKMALLVCAVVLTLVSRLGSPGTALRKSLASANLLCWAGVIVAGRLIAYVEAP
ncbi:MAG TPA: DUF6644 family protein [Polyangiales bacterium]